MITHRRSPARNWAVCGAVRLEYSDNPTCLNCVAGRWVDEISELVRVLTDNSVKDMQEAEDQKALAYLTMYTVTPLMLNQAPPITASNTITTTGNVPSATQAVNGAIDASKAKS